VSRRLLTAGLLTWAMSALAIGLTSTPAGADAPRDQGWWTVTNPGGLPTAPPAPPDVPAKGLLVQGGGGGAPTAFAAVLYELTPGSTAGTLTLTLAPNSAMTPSTTLQLCSLLQPINHPDQGGPMSDAPPYDCAHKVTAAPAPDGKYQFDASGLVSNGLVAVAILPTGPVDRVVLSAPDANSLATEQPPTAATPGANDAAATAAAEPTPSAAVLPGNLGAGAAPRAEVSLPGVAAAGPSSVAPTPASVPARPSTAGGFIPTVSSGPEEAAPLMVLLLVAGSLGAAGLWLYAGRQRADAVVIA